MANLFDKLKKLFSTDVVVRNIGGNKLKIMDTDSIQQISGRGKFGGLYSTMNQAYGFGGAGYSTSAVRLSLFRDYECLSGNTLIPLPSGNKMKIAELSKLYPNKDTKFFVFSYDINSKSIKIGTAHSVKKIKTDKTYKISFNNTDYVIATIDHPFLMKNGKYKKVCDIKVGNSIMPFISKSKCNVTAIEECIIEDVYDMTVDVYHNFATEHCFVHNCMDLDAIIAGSLDIYADECLDGNTLIPLLNGEKRTIKELCDKKYKNFWVHSINKDGKFAPAECSFAKYNGKKEMYILTFEDNMEVIASENHLWVNSENHFIYTSDLKIDDSIKASISLNDVYDNFIPSYCKIKSIDYIGEKDAYDLVNVRDTHIYAVEISNNTKIFCHNSTVKNEMGDVLRIKAGSTKVQDALENLFYDVLNIEFNLWPWIRSMPIKHNTYIPLLSGENITIKELSDRLKNDSDDEIWVYSIQDGTNKIVPGKVIWCDKNYNSKKIIKIIYDDDTFIEVAPEHPFILRNGKEIRADKLNINDKLMPFYRKLSISDTGKSNINKLNKYEMVYNPSSNEYEYTHRIIAKESGIVKTKHKQVLHHGDFNKYNNCPSNLVPMNFSDHKQLHAKHCKKILHSDEVTKLRMAGIDKYLRSDKRRKRMSEEMSGIYPKPFNEYNNSELHKTHNKIRSNVMLNMWRDPIYRASTCEKLKIKWTEKMNKIYCNCVNSNVSDIFACLKFNKDFITEWKLNNNRKFVRIPDIARKQINHTVKNIEIINEPSDVYCMTVVGHNNENDRHNFATCSKDKFNNVVKDSGVFVKNCKYGDAYLYLEIAEKIGIINTQPMSVYNVNRIEGENPKNPHEVKFVVEGDTFGDLEKFQVAHFRLNSDTNFYPYGKSAIELARRTWKALVLAEDAMLIHRIMRAPERRIFKIDVGNIAPNEVDVYMNNIITKLKKVPFIDPRTGEYNLRFNMMNMTEDFYLPVRGGDSGTSIDSLPGLQYDAIDDIEYLRNKMMAGLKIPKAFLGYDEAVGSRANLACIIPETRIPLLNGKVKTVKELIEDYEKGIKNYVYSIDENTKMIVSGEISWAGYTRKNAELVRVHLNNEKYIDCTPDHKFLMKKGDWINAEMLNEMDSFWSKDDNNYKVVKVEFLDERLDTCDITINNYHNFLTDAGVVIHNSEDVRFARTIERIQKAVISELAKIALIHLYAQGFHERDMVDFELNLTNPSIIYEQEKLELWNSKINLARDIKDLKMLGDGWIYEKIFNMTDDEAREQQRKVVDNTKYAYRLQQIEDEGNDPADTKQGFGDDISNGVGENKDFNLEFDEHEKEKPSENYEKVKPSEDGRRGKKIRTRKKEEPFGEDPLGQKTLNKILKLDADLGYDANKKKHLQRRKKKKIDDFFNFGREKQKRIINENDIENLKNYFISKKTESQPHHSEEHASSDDIQRLDEKVD